MSHYIHPVLTPTKGRTWAFEVTFWRVGGIFKAWETSLAVAPKGDLVGPEATDLNFLENLCCAFKYKAACVVTPARHMSGPQPLQRQETLLIGHSFPWAFSG